MPTETRLLGYGIASRMTQQQLPGPDGQPQVDEQGLPVVSPVLELIFFDQRSGDAIVVPFTEQGLEVLKQAITPSGVIVPPPGTRII